MSFISGIFLSMLEKELSAQTPEIEAYLLALLETLGKDLVAFVEKKLSVNPATQSHAQ